MPHRYFMTSPIYDESQTYYDWSSASQLPSGRFPQMSSDSVDSTSLLLASTPLEISPLTCPSTLPPQPTSSYFDSSFRPSQSAFNQQAWFETSWPAPEMPATPLGYDTTRHFYPSPPTSLGQPSWSPYQAGTELLYDPLPHDNGAGPSQQTTVQPAAVFCNPELRDGSSLYTTLDTPDISARATPNNEDTVNLRQQLLVSSALYPGTPSIKLEQTFSSHTLQTPIPTDSVDIDEDGSAEEEAMEIIHPRPGLVGKGAGKTKRTRTAQACEACRKRKAKCSGCLPGTKCSRCVLKRIECVFEIIQKPQKVLAPAATPFTSPNKKRKRTGLQERFSRPVDTSGPSDATQSYKEYEEQNNLLQLQLDGSASHDYTGNYTYPKTPHFGYTGYPETTGLPFDVSGLPSVLQHNSSNAYPYHTAYPDGASMNTSMSTPSDGSYGSSPSHHEMILASPYDTIPYGSTAQDGYFPTMPVYPARPFGPA